MDSGTPAPPPPRQTRSPRSPVTRRPGRPRRPQPPIPNPHSPASPDTSSSRQRVLAAATAEFATRGFDGTTVDRIAARARLNKAMIYYHFRSKRALYTSVLRDVFTLFGDRLAAIGASADDPALKMDHFVAVFIREGQQLAHVAPMLLREIAEGGRRLDEETYKVMARVMRAVTGIVEEGRAAGRFADVDPLLLYLTTIWPIVVYLATASIRTAVARVAKVDAHRLEPERFIRHMQMLNRRALMPADPGIGQAGDLS
jgi:TetR/AcrR family transcriptional regulator